jgi:hypothetical protein
MFTSPEPDPCGDGFWVVPGVDQTASGGHEKFQPGTVGVAGFKPVSTPLVDQIGEQVAGSDDVDEVLAVAHAALARLTELTAQRAGNQAGGQLGGPEMLDQITGLLKAGNTVDGLVSRLVSGVDRHGACQAITGADLTSWLMLKANFSRPQAAKLIVGARHSARFGLLDQAATCGAVNTFQVAAITQVLQFLPEDLDQTEVDAAEQVLVGLTDRCASDMLARLT